MKKQSIALLSALILLSSAVYADDGGPDGGPDGGDGQRGGDDVTLHTIQATPAMTEQGFSDAFKGMENTSLSGATLGVAAATVAGAAVLLSNSSGTTGTTGTH